MKLRFPYLQRSSRSALGGSLPGFDAIYYNNNYPDVSAEGFDPLEHFLNHGWKEGRDPSEGFSTSGYLAANPDVAESGQNPLLHFLRNGLAEGRKGFVKDLAAPQLRPSQKPASIRPRTNDLGSSFIQGRIDLINHAYISGWVIGSSFADTTIAVEIIVNQFDVINAASKMVMEGKNRSNYDTPHMEFEHHFFPPLNNKIEQIITVKRSTDKFVIGQAVLPPIR